MQLRPYQEQGLQALWNYFKTNKGNPLLCWPTGCHAKGTQILMFNGMLKNVEDVEINDLLMGPDSKPRKVLNLARGREPMVKIKPTKGEEFIVNLGHILSLKSTEEKVKRRSIKGEIWNINLIDYINTSKWFKHTKKLWRTNINFSTKSALPLSPYFMGIFLGDGAFSHQSISITSMDKEILDYFDNEAKINDCSIRVYNNGSKADTHFIKNKVRSHKRTKIHYALEWEGLNQKNSENKFIPHAYKTSSQEDRLKLLAGLLDTDGSLNYSNGFDFISKSKRLADDTAFVARSLGLAAYVKPCEKYSQNGVCGDYYRVSISGDCSIIPNRLSRKKAQSRKQKKDVLVTGFTYEMLPEDDYYGFALDGDHLYLTGDFTVHHNTGKSIVPAEFIRRTLYDYPNQRFLMITHVKELINQNYKKMNEIWPNAPIGIYSAGLKRRDISLPIIYGGIQSMIKIPEAFGHRDLIFIDEAHLISDENSSQYRKFLNVMQQINPNLKVIGLTATAFRTGMGRLTEGSLFTDIAHDLTSLESFNKLIEDGYLCPLFPKRTEIQLDVSNVSIQKGEFVLGQLQHEVDRAEITWKGLQELCYFGQGRRSWLIYATGIEHANHIAEMLNQLGVECASVHSKQSDEYNQAALKAHKSLKLKAIVSYSKLTTGLDHPAVDLIGMFRPTMSVALWVQMLGRGTRVWKEGGYLECYGDNYYIEGGKQNCLVLDFANNAKRLGPINDPMIPHKKGDKEGTVPIKLCENCGVYHHIKAVKCDNCGHPFQFEVKIKSKADTRELIAEYNQAIPEIETFNVSKVIYGRKQKEGKSPYIVATYFCGMEVFKEFVFPENYRYPKSYYDWWRMRHKSEPPKTTAECMTLVSELRAPRKIRVHLNRKLNGKVFPEILSVEM